MRVGSSRPTLPKSHKNKNIAIRFVTRCNWLASWFYFYFNNIPLFRLFIQGPAALVLFVTFVGVLGEIAQRATDRGVRVATLFAQIAQVHALPEGKGLTALRASVRALAREGVSMSNIDLSGADLSSISFRGADLSGADLSEVSLFKADLGVSNLSGADLSGAILRGADLGGAYLNIADLHGAILEEAVLRGAYLGGVDLSAADLSAADLRDAHLQEANLSGANLDSTDLRGVNNLTCSRLKQAKDWALSYRDESLGCGAEIPLPPG